MTAPRKRAEASGVYSGPHACPHPLHPARLKKQGLPQRSCLCRLRSQACKPTRRLRHLWLWPSQPRISPHFWLGNEIWFSHIEIFDCLWKLLASVNALLQLSKKVKQKQLGGQSSGMMSHLGKWSTGSPTDRQGAPTMWQARSGHWDSSHPCTYGPYI